jgi:uncharacterized pyridoxamine 5'-phosphate oxidase family protein
VFLENCILLPKGINEFASNRIFVLGKKCTFMTNNKNLGKRVKNQNHTWTIHRNTTNSFIPLGSNIQFSKTQKKNK